MVELANTRQGLGSGILGELPDLLEEKDLVALSKKEFGLTVIRHTPLLDKPVRKVALCGGAGSFLVSRALAAGADFFITADMKYHEFFDANDRLVIADIGHFESEQLSTDLLITVLREKFFPLPS